MLFPMAYVAEVYFLLLWKKKKKNTMVKNEYIVSDSTHLFLSLYVCSFHTCSFFTIRISWLLNIHNRPFDFGKLYFLRRQKPIFTKLFDKDSILVLWYFVK